MLDGLGPSMMDSASVHDGIFVRPSWKTRPNRSSCRLRPEGTGEVAHDVVELAAEQLVELTDFGQLPQQAGVVAQEAGRGLCAASPLTSLLCLPAPPAATTLRMPRDPQ